MKSKLFCLCGVAAFGMFLSNTLEGLTENAPVYSQDFETMPDAAASAFPEVDPTSTDKNSKKHHKKKRHHRQHSTEKKRQKSHNKQIEKQIKILEKFSIDGYTSSKNYDAVKQLTQYEIALPDAILSEFEAGNYDGILKVNLFEYNNLVTAIKRALNSALDANATEAYNQGTNNFFMSSGNIRQRIESVPGLLQVIGSVLAELNSNEEEDEESDRQLRVLKLIKEAYDLACANPNLGENHQFTRFLRGASRALRVVMVSRATDEFMEKNREYIENSAQKTSKSMGASVNVKSNIDGVNLGSSISASKSEGGSDAGLYVISFGGGLKANVGVGFGKISVNGGLGANITRSAVFFSLEQLLDESIRKGKSIIPFEPEIVKKLLKHREKLQKLERDLMSVFKDDFEAFLRMLSLIPGSVSVEMPDITKSAIVGHVTNIKSSVEASASFLDYVGFKIAAEMNAKIQEKIGGWLTLVSDDFSPADGLSVKYITDFIGKKYDFSQKYGSRSDEVTLLQIVTYLRNYVEVLSTLASNPSDKEASKRKHEIEDLWLPGGRGITSEGREGVLKSMIVTLANLRETTSQDRHIEIFKQGYNEASKLVKLFEFSKDKKDKKGTYRKTTVADNKGFTATLSLPQGISIALTYSDNKGNTFQENNGKYIQIDFSIPFNIGAIIGIKMIQDKLSKASAQWGQERGRDTEQMREALLLATDILSQVGTLSIGDSLSMKILGQSVFTVQMTRIDGNAGEQNVRGLPKYEGTPRKKGAPKPRYETIFKDKNAWVIQYIQSAATTTTNVDAGLISANKSFSKKEKFAQDNTMTYIRSKYNTYAIGLKDKSPATNELNSPLVAFENEQAGPLGKLFLNITDLNSNVRYELQCMYNEIMDNISGSKDEENCSDVFAEFIKSCEDLKKSKNEKNFKKTLNAFNEVLKENYRWNFLPHLNNSFKKK